MNGPQYHVDTDPQLGRPLHRYVVAAFSALAVLSAACSGSLSEAEQHYNAGVENSEAGRWNEAKAEYDVAIDLDPDFTIAYVNRSGAHYSLGNCDGALADADRAIDLDPEFAHAYSARAAADLCLSRLSVAIDDATTAIDLEPSDVNVLAGAYLIRSSALSDRPEEALADDEATIALEPTDVNVLAQAYAYRAFDLASLGRLDEADVAFAMASDLGFDDEACEE